MSDASSPSSGGQLVTLSIGEVSPNAYNPNQMTDDEFAELVAEVRHLGRMPKPIVVRPNGDGYQIVDGEHGWRAAQEVGLTEISCEVVEADDFEAMRQTYKRNQHGTHNQVLLGIMFCQMMDSRGLSRRKLAEEIQVSEGTVRNALEYAKAAGVRNSYAVAELSIRQIRHLNDMPQVIGGWWLKCGADLQALKRAKADTDGCLHWRGRNEFQAFEDEGLTAFVSPPHDATAFVAAVKQLREWDKWERSWLLCGIERSELREYTKHYFKGVWYVRDKSLMDSALEWIVDRKTAEFLLIPQEFADCIAAAEAEPSSPLDFSDRLCAAVMKKHGRKPDSKYHVKRDLKQAEIDTEAPDYIKSSKLPVDAKHDLLRLYKRLQEFKEEGSAHFGSFYEPEYTEDALKAIASGTGVRRNSVHVSEVDADVIQKQLDLDKKTEERIATMSEEDLAGCIVDRLYGPIQNEAHAVFRKKLATFTKPELLVLNQIVDLIDDGAERRERTEKKLAEMEAAGAAYRAAVS